MDIQLLEINCVPRFAILLDRIAYGDWFNDAYSNVLV
jgi:hypothetical protein